MRCGPTRWATTTATSTGCRPRRPVRSWFASTSTTACLGSRSSSTIGTIPKTRTRRRFETAVAIAASLAASHAVRGVPVTLLVGGDPATTSASSPGSTASEDLLDRLCLVVARPVVSAEAPLEGWVRSGLRAAPETSALVIVTSVASAVDVLAARAAAEHHAHPIVVDVTDTLTLAGFARAWNRQVQA